MLDDLLDAQPAARGPVPYRRIALGLAGALIVGLAVVLAVGLLTRPTVSDLPTAAQAQAALVDPCGLMSSDDLADLVPGGVMPGQRASGQDISRCHFRGVDGGETVFMDLLVSTDDSVVTTALGEDILDVLRRARTNEALITPSEQIDGVGDEAWIIDRGQREVWARQGAVLISAVVATGDGRQDVDAARSVVQRALLAVTAL